MANARLLIGVTLLTATTLFLNGCAGHPKGLDKPVNLTEDEKATLVEIALSTPEAQSQLETGAAYTTAVNWLAITWDGANWTAYYHIDADWANDPNLGNIPESAEFYPYVLVNFKEPATWQIATSIDLDTSEVVLVHEYPANKGPN